MGLTAAPMTDAAVRELSRWRYDGEYAVYDESPYEEKRAKGSPLLDPDHRGRYTCFYDGDTLMGYINLARMEGAVYFGIALAPDYCGRGYGPVVTRKAMAMAREKWPSLPLRLVVRIWNARAIRCYEKAGFRPAGRVTRVTPTGPAEFLVRGLRGGKGSGLIAVAAVLPAGGAVGLGTHVFGPVQGHTAALTKQSLFHKKDLLMWWAGCLPPLS